MPGGGRIANPVQMGKGKHMVAKKSMSKALNELYARYDSRDHVDPDPLLFLFGYQNVRDREVVGLIASSLAFGSVRQIIKSIGKVLGQMGDSPADYVMGSSGDSLKSDMGGFRHRWADENDLIDLLAGTGRVIREHGSLEKSFMRGFSHQDEDVVPALISFVSEIVGDEKVNRLLPSPARGSACKRLNLFLRWMVRVDGVDPGGWKAVPASKLLIPLDVHMHRLGILLGMTDRKQGDLKTAREITDGLREYALDDPVKYDFALTRLGIRRDDDREKLLMKLGIWIDGTGKPAPYGRKSGYQGRTN